jgi:hypothetical protein
MLTQFLRVTILKTGIKVVTFFPHYIKMCNFVDEIINERDDGVNLEENSKTIIPT